MDFVNDLKYLLGELIVHITNEIEELDYVAPKHSLCGDLVITFAIIYSGRDVRDNVILFLYSSGEFAMQTSNRKLTTIACMSDPEAFKKIINAVRQNIRSI